MCFLFRLNLSLHVGAGKKIGILNFATKQGVGVNRVWSGLRAGLIITRLPRTRGQALAPRLLQATSRQV